MNELLSTKREDWELESEIAPPGVPLKQFVNVHSENAKEVEEDGREGRSG